MDWDVGGFVGHDFRNGKVILTFFVLVSIEHFGTKLMTGFSLLNSTKAHVIWELATNLL